MVTAVNRSPLLNQLEILRISAAIGLSMEVDTVLERAGMYKIEGEKVYVSVPKNETQSSGR